MVTKKEEQKVAAVSHVEISAPHFKKLTIKIIGTTPYVQNKFSEKARAQMKAKQEAGSQSKKGKAREGKDFIDCYENATYKDAKKDWAGIPAHSIRAAMVNACKIINFKMTIAKLALFVEADGFDNDGTPLVKFSKGARRYFEQAVHNETGVCDIRARPMWDAGWEADLTIRFDADLFNETDVANLLLRAGQQVGIGEGRPNSRKCTGCGWGEFTLA
jgi:hypothetical protein